MKILISLSKSKSKERSMFPGAKRKHVKKVKQLLNGLRADSEQALKAGLELPEFDLCSITVPGTNLFCEGNKGINRENMPQLKGFPIPGSPADSMKRSGSGKVDVSQKFLAMLKERGIKTRRYKADPSSLKAAQNQLVGAKIALRVAEMVDNPDHKKFKMPYFVSNDGYILDGHHGWASILSYCLLYKKTVKMNVIEVDMKIKKLIKLANEFMREQGIAVKTA